VSGRGKITYRSTRESDIPDIIALEATCFPSIPIDKYWQPAMLEAHMRRFQEGQFVAELDGVLVGSATNLRVPIEDALRHHTWRSIAGGGYLGTHEPEGSALYGTEIMVHPEARKRGIAKQLYRMRKDLVVKENMRAYVTGGRIPGYGKLADRMSATEYVKSVVSGERVDRTLTAQLRSGLTVAGVMENYITDPNSHNCATLLVWWNLDYQPRRALTPTEGKEAAPSAAGSGETPRGRAPPERGR
jgi:ribosomal protein S18 acetylase RimI-like enzyme